jgi:hypothetical protein
MVLQKCCARHQALGIAGIAAIHRLRIAAHFAVAAVKYI